MRCRQIRLHAASPLIGNPPGSQKKLSNLKVKCHFFVFLARCSMFVSLCLRLFFLFFILTPLPTHNVNYLTKVVLLMS